MDNIWYILLWSYAVNLLLGNTHGVPTKTLPRYLLARYDKDVSPEGPSGSPLNVTHSLQLKRIISLENQVLSLDTYVSMEWQDEQLRWNPQEFGARVLVRLPSKAIWKPDIILENNADRLSGVPTNEINVVITYDGTVFFIPPAKLQSYCKLDRARVEPNQQVTCSLKFMSWSYDGLSINLLSGPEASILSAFEADFNKDWKLAGISVKRNEYKYDCCPEPYIDLTYTLVLKKL